MPILEYCGEYVSQTASSLDGSRNGSGFRIISCAMLNTAVFAPMLRASAKTMRAEKTMFFRIA